MISVLVMLNNYFHDFATSLVVVSTFGMLSLIKFLEAKGGDDSKNIILALYPKMVHMAGASVIFVFVAGIVRAFTYKEYEWNHAVQSGQVLALMVKHVILFILFGYGMYLWLKVHKKVVLIRKQRRK